jgi:hypothetical protein
MAARPHIDPGSERRSRRRPVLRRAGWLLGLGAYLHHFAGAAGRPRAQSGNHYWCRPRPRNLDVSSRGRVWRRSRSGRPWRSGTAWAGCWSSRRSAGALLRYVLIAPELRRSAPGRPRVRASRRHGRARTGLGSCPRCSCARPRFTLGDVLRVQPARPESRSERARKAAGARGVPGTGRDPHAMPRLVIAGGLV